MISFSEFLTLQLDEDVAQDIDKLNSEISTIDTQMNQRVAPLLQRKTQLQKMLAQKRQQQQAEAKKNGNQQPDKMQAQQQQQAGQTQTTTPGSSGSGTPGSVGNSA